MNVVQTSNPAAQSNTIQLTSPESLSSGVSLQRVVDSNIFLFTIRELGRINIDAWIDRIILETENQADPTVPTFWLHDASPCTTVSMSPYLQHRLSTLIKRFPDRVGYNAVILPKTFVVQIVVLFIRRMPTQSRNQLYFNREEGLRWLVRVATEQRN
jgi:hypothetical protein